MPVSQSSESQPHALIYRGPASCKNCPESIGRVLESPPFSMKVTYVGPDEDSDITDALKSQPVLYAQPGGGELEDAYVHIKKHRGAIRSYVENGGRYLGFCLGAYLAGHGPGLDLLDGQDDTDSEFQRKNAQVRDDREAIIQVDWTFSNGTTVNGRWMYFQDGAVLKLAKNSSAKVLARYTSNADPAATLSTFGKGWVGLVGPHPEANRAWYDDANLVNPDGVRMDIAQDFVQTVLDAK